MEISRHWRLQEQRYSIAGEQCTQCDAKIFPPKGVCPHCGGGPTKKFPFSGRGKIYSYTTIYDPPEGFVSGAPYSVAIVELEEGPFVTAQLTDITRRYEDNMVVGIATIIHGIIVKLGIGSPVKMVTRKLREDGTNGKGMLVYGYKFEPDEKALLEWGRGRRIKTIQDRPLDDRYEQVNQICNNLVRISEA